MFVVTDLLALQNHESDENGKAIMSWVIVIVNAIAASLYPMYKFFNAWSEGGKIDFSFIKKNLFASKIKDAAEEVQEHMNEDKTNVMQISGEVCTYAW